MGESSGRRVLRGTTDMSRLLVLRVSTIDHVGSHTSLKNQSIEQASFQIPRDR